MVIKLKILNRKPKIKEKKTYTKEEINQRDKYGFRAKDYFITIIIAVVSFIVIYYYYHWDINKTLLAVLLITIIILLLLRRIVEAEKPEETKEGYLITWIDPMGFYDILPQHNMKLVYGKARQLPDGSLESIPESFILTYYKKKEMQRRFNPMVPQCIQHIKMLQEVKGEPVYMTDGVDKFRSPMQAMINKSKVLKSAGLTMKNITMTTDWMKRRTTIVDE